MWIRIPLNIKKNNFVSVIDLILKNIFFSFVKLLFMCMKQESDFFKNVEII